MLGFDLQALRRPVRFLFLGAHCDDIEIGCGGTILQLAERYPDAEFHWVTFASDDVRRRETEACAAQWLAGRTTSVRIESFQESTFPSQTVELKAYIEEVKKQVQPDVVFTHHRDDRHQDHRTVSDLTWNSFRDHVVLEYEIPKFDGDLGIPNLFVPIPEVDLKRKVDSLLTNFASQADRYWFTEETFRGLMRIRGVEARSPTGYAEAFHARKITFIANDAPNIVPSTGDNP